MKREKNDEQLTLEMVLKMREIRPKKVKETGKVTMLRIYGKGKF